MAAPKTIPTLKGAHLTRLDAAIASITALLAEIDACVDYVDFCGVTDDDVLPALSMIRENVDRSLDGPVGGINGAPHDRYDLRQLDLEQMIAERVPA